MPNIGAEIPALKKPLRPRLDCDATILKIRADPTGAGGTARRALNYPGFRVLPTVSKDKKKHSLEEA